LFPVLTFGLGTWQIGRRQWKLNLIDALKERTTAEPQPLEQCMDQLDDMEYMRVKVRGHFEHTGEMHIALRAPADDNTARAGSMGGGKRAAGGNVITPFILENGFVQILVNRGWVPFDKIQPQMRPEGQVEGVIDLVGLVRHSDERTQFVPANRPKENQWFRRDVEAMARNADTAPIFLDAVEGNTVEGGPIGGQTRVTIRNEHASYIVTW
ncbi:hypothetical protein CAPTEDRAFT_97989, partial [Capitella teleta]